MEFSELLIEEHKSIRRALAVLGVMTELAEKHNSGDRHDVNALLIFLHYFADACHQAKEENVLFPALRQSKAYVGSRSSQNRWVERLERLLEAHQEERFLVEKTQIALFSEKSSEFAKNARKLIDLLSRHCLEEEQSLFPMAERALTREEANTVLMRFEEADAEFGHSQRDLLVELLHELEAKYLPKAA
jgi:hemerythrin-like domain-containing protein